MRVGQRNEIKRKFYKIIEYFDSDGGDWRVYSPAKLIHSPENVEITFYVPFSRPCRSR